MKVKNYKELIVWQKSIELVCEVYRLVKKLPQEERFALSSQLRRAAVSVPSNIAEGQSRNSTRDFANFLSIAKGSNAEVETQLEICSRLGYLTPSQLETAVALCSEVNRMLSSLIARLTSPH